ncbi:MAG: hypothetical protein J6P56_02875 [Bacteroidales bacterium]|jgi:hypothetical protein|nr:hypothetical protein [Bacteroidales bacterium]
MRRSTVILAAGLAAALIAACTKQSLQTTYDKQTTYIENFVSAQMKTDTNATLTRNGGAYRLTLHDTLSADRDSLLWGQKVALYYGCFTLTSASVSSSNLVSTNIQELAKKAGWSLSDTTIFKLDTITLDKNLLPGLADGLTGVQELDEGYILFTGKYGYGKNERGMIPALSALVYYFAIDEIFNE